MKCIFIDLDGTLLPRSSSSIPLKNKEALFKAHQKGHKLILSTGRSFADLEDEIFDLPFDYLILAGGSAILNRDQEVIFTQAMPKKDVLEVIDVLHQKEIGFTLESVFRNYYDGKDTIDFFNNHFHHLDELDTYFPLSDIQDEQDYDRFLKFSLYCLKEGKIPEVVSLFKDQLHALNNPNLGEYYNGEFTSLTVSKQTGMAKVLELLKMDQKDSVAIGDSNNDYKALEYANIKIAMGNATDSLKEIATYITDLDTNDGFYKAFEHFKFI